jgi:uncharacterized protein (DUF1697 family)
LTQHILLLRGINLGSRNRISMPDLRDVLTDAGLEDVRTYLQSGNVLLSGGTKAEDVRRMCQRLIEERFRLEVPVVVRTRAQLAKIVERNPLRDVATDPKRYQVTFLDTKPTRDVIRRVEEAAAPDERVVAIGREIYAWHPRTIARSRLWTFLAGKELGMTATARNWTTVTSLLSMTQESA